MKTRSSKIRWRLTIAALGATGALVAGCQSSPKTTSTVVGATDHAQQPAEVGANEGLTGAQLWAQTCAHCHNSRSPGSYSDAQWETALSHMRQQAELPGDQARKILEFLKASN